MSLCGRAVKVEINQKGRRLLIVADEIAHQHVKDVVVHWNCAAKPRHAGRFGLFTDKRTAFSSLNHKSSSTCLLGTV